ncbi:hypothetical protein AAK706_13125 [Erysipelotrichaceae bacterium 66-17]
MDFRKTRDSNFVQGKIIKELEKMEKELRNQKYIPMSSILFNHGYTKGSVLSDLHSELSKWSHSLNINLYVISSVHDNRISLQIESEMTPFLQTFIKKYTEGLYLLLSDYAFLFSINSKEYLDLNHEMIKLYEKYIDLFYKEL